MASGVNTLHRRHWKSGSCLSQVRLDEAPFHSNRFRALLSRVAEEARRRKRIGDTEATAVLTRPAYFERTANPRTTQSLFGRVASKMMGLFGRKAA